MPGPRCSPRSSDTCLVIVGLMFDLGRPWFIWHQLIYMNPHSVMFEVGFCVMFYTTVLMFEFSAAVLERFDLVKPLKMVKTCLIPLVIAGILLSTLHQSSLGTLYLIMPTKLHPFWYSPALPFFFFISAVCGGPGDDDLRVVVEFAGLWTAVGAADHRGTGRRPLRDAVDLCAAAL